MQAGDGPLMYDPKCLDLAKAFLSDHPALDTPKLHKQLAQIIQDTIEEEIGVMEDEQQADAPS